jgi:hypothetical protein
VQAAFFLLWWCISEPLLMFPSCCGTFQWGGSICIRN